MLLSIQKDKWNPLAESNIHSQPMSQWVWVDSMHVRYLQFERGLDPNGMANTVFKLAYRMNDSTKLTKIFSFIYKEIGLKCRKYVELNSLSLTIPWRKHSKLKMSFFNVQHGFHRMVEMNLKKTSSFDNLPRKKKRKLFVPPFFN